MALITVIIPSYNMPEGAVCAIDSVLGQNIDLRIVVIDDCSNPPLELPDRILKDDQVRLIRQPKNRGVAAARNLGVEACQTQWLTFLDSDDQLTPNTLLPRLHYVEETLNQAIKNTGKPTSEVHSNSFVCCGWSNPEYSPDSDEIRVPNPANKPEKFASGCWYSPGSCAIFHRSVFEVPDRTFDETIRRLEDLDWGLRFGLSGGELFAHSICGVKIRPSNRTNAKAIETATKQFEQKFSYLKRDRPRVYKSLLAYLALERAAFLFHEKKWAGAVLQGIQSWLHRPRITRHFSPRWTYIRSRGNESEGGSQ